MENKIEDFGRGRIGISLHLKREDLLIGLNSYVETLKQDIELGIKQAFENFDFSLNVSKRVEMITNQIIEESITNYFRNNEIKEDLKNKISPIIKESLNKMVIK